MRHQISIKKVNERFGVVFTHEGTKYLYFYSDILPSAESAALSLARSLENHGIDFLNFNDLEIVRAKLGRKGQQVWRTDSFKPTKREENAK